MHRVAVLLTAGLALTACAAGASAESEVLGGWQLIAMTRDGEALRLPQGVEGTLRVESERLGGTSFCNSFDATYRLDDSWLRVEDLLQTAVGCTGDVGRAESIYLGVLDGGRVRVVVDGDELVLATGEVRLRFSRRPAASATPTRWCPAACSSRPGSPG